jgi:hypothetical protein
MRPTLRLCLSPHPLTSSSRRCALYLFFQLNSSPSALTHESTQAHAKSRNYPHPSPPPAAPHRGTPVHPHPLAFYLPQSPCPSPPVPPLDLAASPHHRRHRPTYPPPTAGADRRRASASQRAPSPRPPPGPRLPTAALAPTRTGEAAPARSRILAELPGLARKSRPAPSNAGRFPGRVVGGAPPTLPRACARARAEISAACRFPAAHSPGEPSAPSRPALAGNAAPGSRDLAR